MSEHVQSEPTSAPEAPQARGGLIRVAAAASFILVVMAAECLAVYFMLPSASDLAGAVEARIKQQARPASSAEEEEAVEKEKVETTEVDLGTYTVGSHQPAANTTLRVDFKLVGTVAASDKAAFDELFAKNGNRLRDQVIFEVRAAEVNDLTDPGLGLLKRRILARVNALLGKPMVQGVLFSDFSFVGA